MEQKVRKAENAIHEQSLEKNRYLLFLIPFVTKRQDATPIRVSRRDLMNRTILAWRMGSPAEGIFGTPVEPLFNNKANGSSPAILQDCLTNMAISNALGIKDDSSKNTLFCSGDYAEYVILLCERFDLPDEAKFAALDLFGRFMQKHLEHLYAHVHNSSSCKKKSEWEVILDRVGNQAFLRILSCCQIASKLHSHYKFITVRRAKRCLHEAGYSYSMEAILQSEMRVLKTLSYNVSSHSILDYVEILLEILGHNTNGKILDVKVYHHIAIKILHLIYLHRSDIYNRLFLKTAQLSALQQHEALLASVKADKMLLAVAVVSTAVHLTDDTLTRLVVYHLHKISEIPVEDIEDFANTLLESLHDYQE